MRNYRQARHVLLGTLLTASALGSGVQAQNGAAIPPKPGAPAEVVINCCKCIGQASGAISISTGTAPWRVSSVATPNWQNAAQWGIPANNMNGPTNSSPLVVPGNLGVNPLSVWTAALAPAAWLQPTASSSMANLANGHYTYQLRIRVPNCVIRQAVYISGRIAADDLAKVYVDNTPVALSGTSTSPFWPGAGFGAPVSFNQKLGPGAFTAPGVYTLRVEVENLGGGPTGIVLNGTANGKCDSRPEKGRDEREDRD